MNPKRFLSCIALSIAFFPAFARETVTKKEQAAKSPKFVAGIHAGVNSSLLQTAPYEPVIYNVGGLTAQTGAGVFARYYFGKHFAVEAGVNFGRMNRNESFDNGEEKPRTEKVTGYSYGVPVQLQYHILSPGSKIRPFVGVGGMVTEGRYTLNRSYTKTSTSRSYNLMAYQREWVISQGITWQVNNRLQINQSLMFRKGAETLSTDLHAGVGYTFGNR